MSGPRHVLTVLAVEDVEESARFYAQALEAERQVDEAVYVELRLAGGMRLGLYAREGFARNVGGALPHRVPKGELAPLELYLHVDDLGAACECVAAAGGRLLSAAAPRPWGDEAAYYADPDGNVIVLARPLSPTAAAPEEVAARWMSAWQGADPAVLRDVHGPDFVDRSPAGRSDDTEAFIAGVRALYARYPDFYAVTEDLVVDPAAGRVAVRWSATATPAAPEGAPVERFAGIEILTVRDGLVRERWGEWSG